MVEDIYNFFFNADDVHSKVLVKYWSVTLLIIGVYILLVKWIVPKIMEDRKPFDLRTAIVVYNFFQTFVNAYISYHLIMIIVQTWGMRCRFQYNPDTDSYMKKHKKYIWYLYLTKLADLMDTIFFVFRKKNNQVSFLHVFHHSSMVLIVQANLRQQQFGYFLLFSLTINTCIHIVMYFYYALTAMGPRVQKYLWWKRYITIIQIIQFVVILIYMATGFITGCEDVGSTEMVCFSFVVMILALFANFYIKSFFKKPRQNGDINITMPKSNGTANGIHSPYSNGVVKSTSKALNGHEINSKWHN